MITFPNCKVNLGLNVREKRPDGYHNLESIFIPVPFYDVLEVVESNEFSFHQDGLEINCKTEDNLCVKAYELLKSKYQLPPVKIELLKKIPTQAGLGGGSADGSFMLKLLNELFELNLSIAELENYALKLGSDCPFFIRNRPAYVSGRGEYVEEIDFDLSNKYIVIAMPGISISTKEAFASIIPKPSIKNYALKHFAPIKEWKEHFQNDFEPYAFSQYPILKEIKNKLDEAGASYTSMSGTGSSIYGIFETEPNFKMEGIKIFTASLISKLTN